MDLIKELLSLHEQWKNLTYKAKNTELFSDWAEKLCPHEKRRCRTERMTTGITPLNYCVDVCDRCGKAWYYLEDRQ
jgi:hypothetical protein